MGWFHQHIYVQILLEQIPKAQKDSQVNSVSLSFGIFVQKKLLLKCWWNRPQVSLKIQNLQVGLNKYM
jgi:hypothetical protein